MTTIVFISVLSQSSANESDVPQQLRAWPSDGERPNNPSQALEANARLAFYCQSVSLNNIQTVRTASPQTAHYFQTKFFCCFCFSFLFFFSHCKVSMQLQQVVAPPSPVCLHLLPRGATSEGSCRMLQCLLWHGDLRICCSVLFSNVVRD